MKSSFLTMMFAILFATSGCAQTQNEQEPSLPEIPPTEENLPKVYFYKEISSENLVKIYEALGREAKGRVAVKLSTGEPGGHNFLQPALIKDLVQKVNGTMDAEGETELPVTGGKHLTRDIVGKNYLNYDFTIILSHFKGHAMGGFGGAIKNMSIGIASSNGKRLIHSAGTSTTSWGNPAQDDFLESMAEAAKAVADHCGGNILYISVANNLSVDCDCDSSPADPEMGDIGILASLDPVALDRACTDLVRSSEDHGKIHLIERIDSRHGMHTLDHAESLGMGSQKYELVELD